MFDFEHWQPAFLVMLLISGAAVLIQTLIECKLWQKRAARQTIPNPVQKQHFADAFDRLADHPTPGNIQAAARLALEFPLHSGSFAFHADECLNRYSSGDWRKAEPTDWKPHCTEEGYRALLCFGTVHPNGYLREKSLKALLAGTGAPQYLPFVLLRVNDWVEVIRRAAVQSLPRLIRYAEIKRLMETMPYFEYVRRSGRIARDGIYDAAQTELLLAKRFAEMPDLLFDREPEVIRQLCYAMLCRVQDWQESHTILLSVWLARERSTMLRERLTLLYLHSSPTVSHLDELCRSKRGRIRLQACERRIREEGMWADFEQLLLDPSAAVREFAAYHLHSAGRGAECLTFCRACLPDSALALAELGSKEDIPAIRACYDADAKRPECLTALVRLGVPDAESLVWEALHSGSPRLARTAYRIAWKRHLRFDTQEMLREIETGAEPMLRWRLFRLLRMTGDWRMIPHLLHMLRDYPHLRPDIVSAIENRDSGCQSLPSDLAAQIREGMEAAGELLPEETAKQLRFDLRRLE